VFAVPAVGGEEPPPPAPPEEPPGEEAPPDPEEGGEGPSDPVPPAEEPSPPEEGGETPGAEKEETTPDETAPEPGKDVEEKEETPPEVVYMPPPIRSLKPKEKSFLVLEPRAMSYKFLIERIHMGSGSDEGSKIKLERHLGVDRTLFLSPEINTQFNFKILGFLARLHLSYTNTTLHGLALLTKDIRFNGTTFPVGMIVGTQFTHRRARIRYFQEVFQSESVTVDINVGGDYIFFRNILESPGFTQEKDVTETALPILGARVFATPFSWGRFFACASGFYWNLGRDMGATGSFEVSVGVAVYFTKTWGFLLDLSFLRLSVREERFSRAQIDYWEFGPGLTLYASI
jgi:hypothetical protein